MDKQVNYSTMTRRALAFGVDSILLIAVGLAFVLGMVLPLSIPDIESPSDLLAGIGTRMATTTILFFCLQ